MKTTVRAHCGLELMRKSAKRSVLAHSLAPTFAKIFEISNFDVDD